MKNRSTNRSSTKRLNPSVSNSRRKRVARQLAAYSVAAGTGVVGASDALAAPIPVNLPGGGPVIVPITSSLDLDIDNDSNFDFEIDNGSANFSPSIEMANFGSRVYTEPYAGTYLATFFGAGELIDGSSFGAMGFGELDNFFDSRGFVGLRFDIPGGSPHFAYLDVGVDTSAQTVTVYGGAYESQTGVGITTVPEPTGLGLLAMGAAGIATWRRREDATS